MNRKFCFGFLFVLLVVFLNIKLLSSYVKAKNYIFYKNNRNISEIENIISQMDIKTKIASLLMINFYENIDITLELIKKVKISSFIIMSYNVDQDYESFRKKINFIKSHSNILPITFSVDQEGGYVERLSPVLGKTDSLRRNKWGRKYCPQVWKGIEGTRNRYKFFSSH